MNAKKPPSPKEPGHAEQTRKVDGMSELVAGLLLAHPDGAPPDPTPGSATAVRPTDQARRQSEKRETRVWRAIAIGLAVALGLAALVASALLLSR